MEVLLRCPVLSPVSWRIIKPPGESIFQRCYIRILVQNIFKMDAFTGKYYVQGGEERDATILFLKDRLSIGIRDEHGNSKVVYWPYDHIIRYSFWKRGQSIVSCRTYPLQTREIGSREFSDNLESVF